MCILIFKLESITSFNSLSIIFHISCFGITILTVLPTGLFLLPKWADQHSLPFSVLTLCEYYEWSLEVPQTHLSEWQKKQINILSVLM